MTDTDPPFSLTRLLPSGRPSASACRRTQRGGIGRGSQESRQPQRPPLPVRHRHSVRTPCPVSRPGSSQLASARHLVGWHHRRTRPTRHSPGVTTRREPFAAHLSRCDSRKDLYSGRSRPRTERERASMSLDDQGFRPRRSDSRGIRTLAPTVAQHVARELIDEDLRLSTRALWSGSWPDCVRGGDEGGPPQARTRPPRDRRSRRTTPAKRQCAASLARRETSTNCQAATVPSARTPPRRRERSRSSDSRSRNASRPCTPSWN